ncbi:unnamed protein product [Acanthoscelides obtectus]|uniref:Alpha-mannosidase n=1 Tax=Acanthoscelides obtectus TaxID=200917 RepID=A0A9P0KJ39_ACAOB|nr:unnamed protein product [Acanthoscelides obtectus]CAK1644803.1 Lysosomal alpha-mannosidase [Acanthoscelides obtectus]
MWRLFLLISLFAFPTSSRAAPAASEKTCGYQSCHPVKEGFINVHLVPHTHDDVGWLKTLDQYYYGSRTQTQNAGVQYIIESVIDALAKDPNRRFIYVETAFFWKWWIKQHDTVKAQVRRFVNSGRLEFISGGWSMNDEAATHYQSIIDQMAWGLRKLNDSFGECGRPKMGWQIDPFGHSREMASIFAQLGFDGVLLGRIDYQDKHFRLASKTPEMVWKSSQSLGESSNIFTGVLYNIYIAPSGFCFDILCSDDPIIDDKDSYDYNVDKRVDQFFAHLDNMTKVYETHNLIITMGDDFNYQVAEKWFKNLDKLIYYANLRQKTGSKYNLIYSTPSCYVKAIHEESTKTNKKWLVKTDDFFPYASDPHAYWTGYFTSRPTLKRFEREGNNYLQVCKQLYALADLGPEDRVDLNVMREAMGVMQHHDAVSGTEKEHVAHDYARLLSRGFDECHIITNAALSQIVTQKTNRADKIPPQPARIEFNTCPLLNVSQCELTESKDPFVVTVYNPLSRPVTKFVRLPVTGTSYSVKGPDGEQLQTQLIPIATAILTIPGRDSKATAELIFRAKDLPPLGFKSYYVERVAGNTVSQHQMERDSKGDTQFEIDRSTGLISHIYMNGRDIPLDQNFLYYEGYVGNNEIFPNRSSGAYIFRPTGAAQVASDSAKVTIFKGSLVNEVHQVFNDWISQIVRVYADESYIEFDWLVGPIPIIPGQNGKEVITRFTTPLKTSSQFYTDSNGREMLKRVRNTRPTWKLQLEEPVAGNYYPVTSKIVITDGDLELAVLTDRAQGGTSLEDGEVELMVHRACMHDDAFGVGEALLEEAFNRGLVARGSHYVVLGSRNTSNPDGRTVAAQERDLAQQKLLSAWTFISKTQGLTFKEYNAKYRMEFSGLKKSLPDNVQILTLEPWFGYTFLLRLEHVLESKEDPNLSEPVTVNLNDIFTPFQITTIKETTLGGNQWLSDNHRLHFETAGKLEDLLREEGAFDDTKSTEESTHTKRATIIDASEDVDNLKIKLTPMQIRTFIIEIKVNSAS